MGSFCLLFIFTVSLWINACSSSITDQMAEITQLCCGQGLTYAKNHTSQDCSSSVPPEVPQTFGSLCIYAMDGCCKEYFEKNRDCEDGVQLAASSQCNSAKSETAKNCCNECLRGHRTGGSNCEKSSRTESADDSLAFGAYLQCCQKKASKEGDAGSGDVRRTSPKTPTYSAPDLMSVCEEFAPNELCAHHCIPVPGSYRCECNPGFKLMEDGRNCMEVQKNRCKPRNSCQHKCNDNGVEIKCTCRRGYQLLSDGRSCKDIDECKLDPPVCLTNTECHNTQGSYKCIPHRKHSAEKGRCPAGFTRNTLSNVCDDVDECSLVKPPCPKYICENTIGAYKCDGILGDPANLDLPRNSQPAASPTASEEERCPPGFRAGVNEECEDIDECATNKHDCNPLSQFCINVRGHFYCQNKVSKHCMPGFKINSQTGVCEDIDECVDSHSLCQMDQICVNVPGAYDCKPKAELQARVSKRCQEGTRWNSINSVCEDIDECSEGTHLCDPHQTCLNTYASHECRCKIGFEHDQLTGACVDINECATHQHQCMPETQRCDNTIGSYLCVRIISCGTGYVLQYSTGKCEDIDECAVGTDNCARAGPNYQCVNNPGSYRCVRMRSAASSTSTSTTTPHPEYEYYYDSEEEDTADDTNKTVPAKPVPVAPIEKVIPPTTTTPEPIPEIPSSYPTTSPTPNPRPTEPQIQETSPKTDELPEYNSITYDQYPVQKPNPSSEIPPTIAIIPETTIQYRSVPEVSVTTTPKLEKERPELVEIDVPKDSVTVKGENKEDGSVVVETKDIPKHQWTNVVGQPEPASCQNGFERDDYGACVDVDECATGKHICSGLTESCRNTIGGYVCDCAAGFRRDITGVCDLIQISSTTSTTPTTPSSSPQTPSQWSNWGYPEYHAPQSRPFKPRNICDVGYHLSTSTGQCEDVDECTNGVANCAAVEVCINTQGGYRCECPPNWQLDEIRHRCVPVRDPAKFPPGYGNVDGGSAAGEDSRRKIVTIVSGSRHGRPGNRVVEPTFVNVNERGGVLQCPWGYKLGEDNTCVDIDECATDAASCAMEQLCTNLPGGYACSCPPGHKLVGDPLSTSSCEDVDECALAGARPICSEHADCVNTVGSYQCRCHKGFRTAPANDKVCVDVDECTEMRSGSLCQHRCNNVWGGYRCSCHRGYRLNADNRTCSDIDECIEFASKNLCVGRCLNEPGSYRCSCPSGYRLSEDKRSCIDIDECDTGEAPCSAGGTQFGVSDVCLNTRGAYRCQRIVCPAGYQLENKHRCTKIDRFCPVTDWECIHQPSTYSYNYITFVSKLYIPSTIDLFTMRGPTWQSAQIKFQLRLVDVNAPPTVKHKADINAFLLVPTANQAVVSLVRSLEGPQSIELELVMELFNGKQFAGKAVAKIFIYVSEYEF